MLPSESLAAAIERLYAVFGSVPRPKAIERCEHCWTDRDVAPLLAPVPLRELSFEALRRYSFSALLTVGGIEDYLYFLPRILEFACTRGIEWPDLEIPAERLRDLDWTTWATGEQAAIRAFLWACWKQALGEDPGSLEAARVLLAISSAEEEPGPYLDEWRSVLQRQSGAVALLGLLHRARFKDGGLRLDDFCEDRDQPVVRWLLSAEVRTAVADAFERAETEETMQALAGIDDLLAVYAR